jgi:hypothetical protein
MESIKSLLHEEISRRSILEAFKIMLLAKMRLSESFSVSVSNLIPVIVKENFFIDSSTTPEADVAFLIILPELTNNLSRIKGLILFDNLEINEKPINDFFSGLFADFLSALELEVDEIFIVGWLIIKDDREIPSPKNILNQFIPESLTVGILTEYFTESWAEESTKLNSQLKRFIEFENKL